jgi:hypothetical protein
VYDCTSRPLGDAENWKPRAFRARRTPRSRPVATGSGDAGQKICTGCAKSNAATANTCRQCGRLLPRNRINGANSVRRLLHAPATLPPDLRVSIDAFREALISDQGGIADLTAVRAGLCRLLVDTEAGKRLLMNEVIAKGVNSKPGRQAYDPGCWQPGDRRDRRQVERHRHARAERPFPWTLNDRGLTAPATPTVALEYSLR